MKLVILVDNNILEDKNHDEAVLRNEHGLSIFVETKNGKYLFDFGQGDTTMLDNSRALGVDLSHVDTAFLSHGHYDHSGGILAFTSVNKNAKIVAHRDVVLPYFSDSTGSRRYIGLPENLLSNKTVLNRFLFVGEEDEDIEASFGDVCCFSIEKKQLRYRMPRGNSLLFDCDAKEDEFAHEIYFVVSEGDKKVLISGCAHKGICNILEAYKSRFDDMPDLVVSGLHLSSETDEDALMVARELSDLLKGSKTCILTGHCTGAKYGLIKGVLGDKIKRFETGFDVCV